MNRLDSDTAFQKILKNAPEMPTPKIPEDEPILNNGNIGMIFSVVTLLLGQALIYLAFQKTQVEMLEKLNFNRIGSKDE
jgi:hypothetical protein